MPARVRRRLRRSRTALSSTALFVLVMLVVALAAGVGLVYLYLLTPPSGPSVPIVNASLRVNGAASPTSLPAGFLGVNAVVTQPLSSANAAAVNSTEVRGVRWPGGNLAERFDPMAAAGAGVITNDSGRTTLAATSALTFVDWCRAVGCSAIVTLPAEIDDPGMAASIVGYYEHNLSFRPAEWEIGNEPAIWSHFGIAWSAWNLSQDQGPTPATFAAEVQQYVSAIRTVDSTTPIIGLGGVGTGSANETDWISAVVQKNGPSLSGVAIHLYPAGAGVSGETLGAFYQTIGGPGGLGPRVAADRAAIAAACSSCRLGLYVDEFNAAIGGNLTPYLSGYAMVPYIAAELTQGATLGVGSMDYWSLQASAPGAWLGTNGYPRPVYTLYSALFNDLPTGVLPCKVTAPDAGLFCLALTSSSPAPNATLVLTNLNASVGFRFNLSSSGFPVAKAYEAQLWNSTQPRPVATAWPAGSSPPWTLPPGGIGVWRAGAGAVFSVAASAAAHSENSATSPGSIVPNASVVKNCFTALVAGQIGSQRSSPRHRSFTA